MSFSDLLMPPIPGLTVGEQQRRAIAEFPVLIQKSRFKLWSPSEPIPSSNVTVLLGIATFSLNDLKLLDEFDRQMAYPHSQRQTEILIFNNATFPHPMNSDGQLGELLRGLITTPTIVILENGVIIDHGGGLPIVRDKFARAIGLRV